MKRSSIAIVAVLLGSCAQPPVVTNQADPSMLAELDAAARHAGSRQPDAIREALLPPLRAEMPKMPGAPLESRFDLVVNTAPAQQVFISIVSGTRYSMVVNPAVSGTLSLNLKDVTVPEALEAIREGYGYEFRIDGTRIYVEAAGLQTRVFQVNYLIGLRSGRSEVRVSSGAVTTQQPGAAGAVPTMAAGLGGVTAASPALGAVGLSSIASTSLDASRVSTVSQSDFWTEIVLALRTLIGPGEGRSVVVSPQAGVIVVRAMPGELRTVERYLKAMRLSVERQVMIEAKIIEVTLSQDYQAGINWAAFPTSGLSAGQVSRGTLLQRSPPAGGSAALVTGVTGITGDPGAITSIAGGAVGSLPGNNLINFTNPGASLFGLAFQTRNFAALLTFLETQGAVQVLSSPRVAALNNQKAVLKVGTDQFFVTNVTSTPLQNTGGAVTGAIITPTFNPFFSGVSLDITPQIDEDGNILLHIHPLVADVQNSPISFDFGQGATDIPLAKSSVNETDTMVRAQDGDIVALGGLMQIQITSQKSGIPGLQDIPGIGAAFRSTTRTTVKKELVILLKPTVIKGERESEQDIQQARDRMQNLGAHMGAGSSEPAK